MNEMLPNNGVGVSESNHNQFLDGVNKILDDALTDRHPKGYTIIGPAEADPRRVLVQDSDGISWDVTLEKAEWLTGNS